MKKQVERKTVDLSEFPDLVVMYLGMQVNTLKGFATMLRYFPRVGKVMREEPEGLLNSSFWFYSIRHLGLRQDWRDFESLETWTRSLPHREWWRNFLRDSGGTGFYHELYFRRGGMEAMYVDITRPLGFMNFAPVEPARGPMFSARTRLGLAGEAGEAPPISEQEFYGEDRVS